MIWALLLVVPMFFLWSGIHEVSHYISAKYLVGAKDPKFKIYPHKVGERFVWASVRYTRTFFSVPPANSFLVSMAPRLPGLIACLLTGYAVLLTGTPQLIWLVCVGAGAVDYFVGLIGHSDFSDLQRAARIMEVSPWKVRALFAPPLLIPLATVGLILMDLRLL